MPPLSASRPESLRRFIAALSLPLVAVTLGTLGYELLVVPWVQAGNSVSQLVWLLIYGSIPLALIVSGALVEKNSSAFGIVVIVTVFRRGSAAVLAHFHAPGHLKLDIGDADFWTCWLAIEFCFSLPGAVIGRFLGASIRREREVASAQG
jgi:hypothetical protein